MQSFNEFIVQYVVVEAATALIPQQALINEGRWVQSGVQDYMMRVDPENPAIPLLRHVHIAKAKHVSSKNMQVAWNNDGTIHDKRSFNHQMATISAVQAVARAALNIPQNIKLEESKFTSGSLLVESINESGGLPYEPYFLKAIAA